MDDDFFAEFDADIQHATANAKDDVTEQKPTITDAAAAAKRAKTSDGAVAITATDSKTKSNVHLQNAGAKVPPKSTSKSESESTSSRKRSRDDKIPAASKAAVGTSWTAPVVNPEYIRVKLSQAGEIVPSIGPAMPPHLMQQQQKQSQPVAGPQPNGSEKEKPAAAGPSESPPSPNFKTPNARSLAYLRGLTPGQAAIVESQQSAYTYNPTAAGRTASTAAAESAIQAAIAAQASAAVTSSEASESAVKSDTVRYAGGKVWEDNTLTEWPENDYRIFVGNLGIECTDELLLSVFADYPSAKRAKVVKEKKTRKVKGFGFVSFMDPFEMVRALKHMNGKYCGSRPMQVRKSDWQKRSLGNAQQEKKAWRKKHGL